tara:strand:- start:704 stop:1003 length:300 start_codon:yes stop_codon:yes gene_type:complete
MASRDLVPPRLPTPPAEVDSVYMNDLVRALETFISQETNPGLMRGTKVTFTAIPTSDTGLEAGTLYRVDEDIKISLLDNAVPDGSSGTSSVGTVTIVTS